MLSLVRTLLLVLVIVTTRTTTMTQADDKALLVNVIKPALLGKCSSSWLSSWTMSNPLSDFEFVTASQDDGLAVVQKLFPYSAGLCGFIPKEISFLKHLNYLDLSYNKKLTGIIPESLGNLKQLTELDLSSCNFTGFPPLDSLSQLRRLEKLLLYENSFLTGPLDALGNLSSSLVDLYLYSCNFTGSLPSSIGQLKNLRDLQLNNNPLLTGSLPPSLFEISSLFYLYLDSCNFTGSLPSSIGQLKNLRYLSLSYNPLLAGSLDSLATISSLTQLVLSSCNFTGNISSLCSLSNLTYLDASDNHFTSSFPSCLLISMSIAPGATVDGAGVLSLQRNEITELEELSPEWIQKLQSAISKNAAIGSLLVKLQENRIKNLPANWGHILPYIAVLHLDFNRIVDTLPIEWSSFASRVPCSFSFTPRLKISNNKIFGTLPASYANIGSTCSSSFVLDFSNNLLNGSLPESWATANFAGPSSKVFLSDNLLSGRIPSSWSNLQLQTLSVRNNSLSGFLPLLNVTQSLDLSQNCLQVNESVANKLLEGQLYSFFDASPSCDSAAPLMVSPSVQLAAPYTWQKLVQCQETSFCYRDKSWTSNFNGTLTTSLVQSRSAFASFSLSVSCTYGVNSLVAYATFSDSCTVGLYKPFIECFTSSASANEATSTCESQGIHVPKPSWHGVMTVIPPLPTQNLVFSAADASYVYGARYRVRFELSFFTYVVPSQFGKSGKPYYDLNHETTIFTELYTGPNCPEQTGGAASIAVSQTTSCAPCPELAVCDGSTNAFVSSSPAWRSASNLLPFYSCPSSTNGCQKQKEDDRDEIDKNLDGTGCKANFVGPLCTRCNTSANFGMLHGECVSCPSHGSLVAVFASGVAIVVVLVALLIYVSIKPRRRGQIVFDSSGSDEKESICIACCPGIDGGHEVDVCDCTALPCCKPLTGKLEQWRPFLEKVVVTVRALINFFTLIGPLSGTAAAKHMSKEILTLLHIQDGVVGAAFGNFAATLTCLFPDYSLSVLHFVLILAVTGCIFFFESLLFLIWTRRTTVAVTVLFFMSWLAYSPLTKNAASLLSLCDTYNFYDARLWLLAGGNAANIEAANVTINLLSSDPSQDCDEHSFSTFRLGAGLVIGLFAVGFPGLVVLSYRSDYLTQRDDLREEMFGFLTKNYRLNAWFFEIIQFARKLAISIIVGVLYTHEALQIQLYSLVVAALLASSLSLQPLMSERANRVEQLCYCSALTCAGLFSLVAAFPHSDGVALFSTITVYATQIISVICLVLFSASTTSTSTTAVLSVTSASASAAAGKAASAAAGGGGAGGGGGYQLQQSLLGDNSELETQGEEQDGGEYSNNSKQQQERALDAEFAQLRQENADLQQKLKRKDQENEKIKQEGESERKKLEGDTEKYKQELEGEKEKREQLELEIEGEREKFKTELEGEREKHQQELDGEKSKNEKLEGETKKLKTDLEGEREKHSRELEGEREKHSRELEGERMKYQKAQEEKEKLEAKIHKLEKEEFN